MKNDTCETVIGKHWESIGSIDWEGHFPILDAKLRVIRVEFIDNIEDDEDFMPVEIHNGRALRLPRGETEAIDAYMTPFDFGVSHGSLIAVYDLCENPGTEEKVDQNFPLYAESGIIVSHFAIIDRDLYFANRAAIDRELMVHAEEQAEREYYAAADDCEPIGIALVEGKGLVATFDWHGEKVQSLVGMLDREPGEGDDSDPITDRPFVRHEPSRDVCIIVPRAECDAFARAALGAVASLDREMETMIEGPRMIDAESARAALNRLVTVLCNASK